MAQHRGHRLKGIRPLTNATGRDANQNSLHITGMQEAHNVIMEVQP
jgi:hypothetical protein